MNKQGPCLTPLVPLLARTRSLPTAKERKTQEKQKERGRERARRGGREEVTAGGERQMKRTRVKEREKGRASGREEGGGVGGVGVVVVVGGGDWYNVTPNPVMNLSLRNSRLQPEISRLISIQIRHKFYMPDV